MRILFQPVLMDSRLMVVPFRLRMLFLLVTLQLLLSGCRAALSEIFRHCTAMQMWMAMLSQLTDLGDTSSNFTAMQKCTSMPRLSAGLCDPLGNLTVIQECRVILFSLTELPDTFSNLTAMQECTVILFL